MEENFVCPPVYIDRAIINSGEENRIKINLLLNLRAPIGSKTITTLSNDLLTIKILEVRSEELSAILQKSSELTKGMIEKQDFTPHEFFISLAVRAGLIDANNADQQNFRDFFETFTEIHDISNEEIKSKDSVNRIAKDNNGNSMLNVYINKSLPEIESTSHLSYFVYSIYDKTKIRGSVNFAVSPEELTNNTKITAETIINKGRVSSETFVYFMEDDSVWTGEVHQDGRLGSWFTGKFSERNKKDTDGNLLRKSLRRRAYYNTKIQDFRVYKRIESRVNQYGDLARRFENFEIINDSYLLKTSDSPIRFVRNSNGKGIVCICSLEDLLQRNSVAYSSIKKINFEILNWGMDDIKVKAYRKRVREYPKDYSVQKETDYLPDFSRNEKKVYLPSNYIAKNINGKILVIMINDRSIPENGEYCYGIELTFNDPVVKKLEEEIGKAEEQEKILLDYSERAKVLSYSDVDGNYYEGNYDQELNRFTEKFINEENQKLVEKAVRKFLEMLTIISKAETDVIEELSVPLIKTCSPNTGTPDSIISFLKLYRTCLSALRRILESSKKKVFLTEEKYFNRRKSKVVKNVTSLPNKFNHNGEYFEMEQIDSLSELCSLTIRKIEDATSNGGSVTGTTPLAARMGMLDSDRIDRPSLSDRMRFPAGRLNSTKMEDIATGIGRLLDGVTIRSDPRDAAPVGNPFAGRGLIGRKIVVTEPATKPIIDYNKSLKDLSTTLVYEPESGGFRTPSNGTSAERGATMPAARGAIEPIDSKLIGATSVGTRVASNGLRANVTDQQPAKATIVDTGNTRILTVPNLESNNPLIFPTRQEQEVPLVRIQPKIITTINYDSQVSDVSRGLAATPAGASTKVVSNATMEEVVQEQVSKKNEFKNRAKRFGR